MSLGDAFTGAGVLIALAALLLSLRVNRRQTDLAQRLTAIEEARRADEIDAQRRARVVPSFRRPEPRRLRFVLTNEGLASAREVDCQIDTLNGRQPPRVMGLEALPVELRSGQPLEFVASAGLGMSAQIRVVVRWVDDAGDQEESFTLNTL
jgi:hypothetical protein